MFTRSEAFYDAIYDTMKDYAAEAQQIHALIQQYKQTSGTALLDVACGTGRHIPFLREHYDYLSAFQASGLDVLYDPDPEKLMGRGVYLGVYR